MSPYSKVYYFFSKAFFKPFRKAFTKHLIAEMVTFARIAKSIPIHTLKTVNQKAKSDPVTIVEPENKFCKII